MRTIALTVLTCCLLVACEDAGDSPPGGSPTSATAGPVPTTAAGSTTPGDTSPTTTDTATGDTNPTGTSTSTTEAPAGTTTTSLPPLQALAYQEVAVTDFPIMVTARPGDATALLAQRNGLISTFDGNGVGEEILDLSGLTTADGERGLLAMARHPQDDARLFVHYTDTAGDTVVSEFALDENLRGDVDTEERLLEVDQPAANHNGGMIQFGPDGGLYLGLGDGGGAGDQFGNGQDTSTFLGGLVRIDVDSGESQLWQYGLRNPWRFWIDADRIWIADVGQRSYEEVNLAGVGEEDLNYGWPITEGRHCYQVSDCDTEGLHEPLIEIPRGDGGACSITGGLVYGGQDIPELDGRFLFSDYCGGFLRSVDTEGRVEDHTDQVGVPGQVVSFGVDGDGEVYVLTTDRVLRLQAER